MSKSDFHNRLAEYYNQNKTKEAASLLMYELAHIFVKKKKDFIDLLNESGVFADERMSDNQLVEAYINNIGRNKKLKLGTALLINLHNKEVSFDGTGKVSDMGTKVSYDVLEEFFIDEAFLGADGENDLESEDFANADDEEYSGVPGLGQAISGAVQGVAGLGTKIAEGQQQKKYGATMMAQKKEESKAILMQQIMAQKQAQLEAQKKEQEQKQKTTRTLLIAGGVVVGLGIIALVIYKMKKSKK